MSAAIRRCVTTLKGKGLSGLLPECKIVMMDTAVTERDVRVVVERRYFYEAEFTVTPESRPQQKPLPIEEAIALTLQQAREEK